MGEKLEVRIGIIGAGSIGLHIAGQLFLAGKDVWLICRSKEQVSRLQENGLIYIDLLGNKKILHPHAIWIKDTSPTFDWLFLTVKQTHLAPLIPELIRLAQASTPIVCFQNGMGHDTRLSQAGIAAPIFLAVTTEGAYRLKHNEIKHTGRGQIWVGPAKNKGDFSAFPQLMQVFAGSELQVEVVESMKERMWHKLVVNCCINPLTAILQVNNGALVESTSARELMEKLFNEAVLVANYEGVRIDQHFLQEIFLVCRNTYHNKSSMLQDIEAERETEIASINGWVLEIALKHGCQAPSHEWATKLILAKQGK
jgi:2-dehydropantoate 2-reductase